MKNISLFLIIFFLLSCKKNDELINTENNNSYEDSTNIAFRLSDIYWNDTSLKQTVEFHFKYDSVNLARWNAIQIQYDLNEGSYNTSYNAEYANGRLIRLMEEGNSMNSIELFYRSLPQDNVNQLYYVKFRREFSPFALMFEYDSSRLVSISKFGLNSAGVDTNIVESKKVCIELNYKICDTASVDMSYQRDFRLNSFYLCKEIIPVLLMLTKPYQTRIDDIGAELPLVFSKYLPASILKPYFGVYELGLNAVKEPSFIYFRPYRAKYPEGFNFVYKK